MRLPTRPPLLTYYLNENETRPFFLFIKIEKFELHAHL